MNAVTVPVERLWAACPHLTWPVLTGIDPLWLRVWSASEKLNLKVRLWSWGLGGDGFDRGGFAIVGGAGRKGVYSWPVCLKVRPTPCVRRRACVPRQARRVAPHLIALLRKDQGEHQVGAILQREFADRALAVRTDCLVDVASAPPDAPVYRWGAVSYAVRPELLVVLPVLYMSDLPQQRFATGRMEGSPLTDNRLTLEHRHQFVDPTVPGHLPAQHHRRMLDSGHVNAMLRMIRRWSRHGGHAAVIGHTHSLIGIARHSVLPYGGWNMMLTTQHDFAHLFMLGATSKFCVWLHTWMQRSDTQLVRRQGTVLFVTRHPFCRVFHRCSCKRAGHSFPACAGGRARSPGTRSPWRSARRRR